MIWRGLDLRGYSVKATDGEVGEVTDFLFDDQSWTVRYAVIDTRRWLPGRKVLIARHLLGQPEAETHDIPVSLTRQQVRESPPIDYDQPVSRQMEARLHRWTAYVGSHGFDYFDIRSPGVAPAVKDVAPERPKKSSLHLRSMTTLKGYRVMATDGEAGVLKGFEVDDEGWIVRFLIIDAGGWITGKAVVIPVDWVRRIHWARRQLLVNVARRQIETSPEYDPGWRIAPAYERQFNGHTGRHHQR
jgi:sporulation protein YlmC with PRC-barrel domain